MNAPIRILLVDDHNLFRRGLAALLAQEPTLQVVGQAGDAGEAQRLLAMLESEQIRIFYARIPANFGVINPEPGDNLHIEQLLEAADGRMYDEKNRKKGAQR